MKKKPKQRPLKLYLSDDYGQPVITGGSNYGRTTLTFCFERANYTKTLYKPSEAREMAAFLAKAADRMQKENRRR